ncbi:MAG: hypothetical protein ABIV63_02465 [Caldimonas sp.]
MKKLIFLALAACSVGSSMAGPNVGVSIGINQPGVYGRVDIGNYPQPLLVYPEPVVVAPPRVVVQRQPIYLYVPPAHQQNWRRYCGRYSACGQPVYFVQDRWVRERWDHEHHDGPRYISERRGPPEHRDNGLHRGHDDRGGHGNGKGHGRGHHKDD